MRLIDADHIDKRIDESIFDADDNEWMHAVVANAPTIEIVRCKDCKWKDKPMIQKDVRCVRACYENVSDDHYCGFGERKDNE